MTWTINTSDTVTNIFWESSLPIQVCQGHELQKFITHADGNSTSGQYTVRFTPAPLDLDSANPVPRPETRHLTIDERAVRNRILPRPFQPGFTHLAVGIGSKSRRRRGLFLPSQ
jgi:hypothetical protein